MIADTANYFSILFAAVAALFWYRCARAEVPPTAGQDPVGEGTLIGKTIITSMSGRRVDIVATMAKQGTLNAWAAVFACGASLGQVVNFLATKFGWL